jgi:capsular exopolysaccharide synthesis family protein
LAQDTSKFGSDYPKLADERSNLASIDKAVTDEVHRIGERAKNDFDAARTTEDKLKAVYDDRKQEAGKLNDRATEYSIAKQEADNSRSLYEDLSKRLKEAGIIEGLRSSNISVVSPGRVSPKPYSPYAPLYLAAALILGLFFGACGALYSDMTDRTVQSFGVVEESLGITFFAVLPTLAKRGLKNLLSIPDNARSYTNESAELINPLVVLDKPNSAFAEALRRMRMSLLSSRVASTPKVILVTSSVRGEGKTTVAVNIAALLAQTGKRVLFVESDLRRPGSTHLFDPSQDSVPGLTELLSNPGLIMKANQIKGAPGMQVLPSGPTTVYPTELLSTDRMCAMLDRWKLEFDHIVMDSPSLLDVTDALILSRLADITLLVARYGFTSNKSLERAYRMLASDSDTRIGVVLNAADRNSVSYSDYYGYSGSTYYQIS